MRTQNRSAILVAGGSGSRMQIATPKQFLLVNDVPILAHTLIAFYKAEVKQLVVVLPYDHMAQWAELAERYVPHIEHKKVAGGNTRFASVQKGLAALKGNGFVAVHDAVRPLVSESLINSCFEAATEDIGVVAAVELTDSIRELSQHGSTAKNRRNYKLVQTPQTFGLQQLKQVYAVNFEDRFTDCASVWEAAGKEVLLIEGEHENRKITQPTDLPVAEAIFRYKNKGHS